MAVAMTALAVNVAWAGPQPKRDSIVTADIVTLGDIFDGVTENAGYVLSPAPAPGKTKTLGVSDLQRVSDAFHLGWAPQNALEQVVIRREATEIDRYAIEAALQQKLAGELAGRKFEMQLSDRSLKIHLPPQYAATVEADDVTYDLAKGEFRAVLSAPSADNPVVKKEIRGRLQALAEVPVLKANVSAGQVIDAADIAYIDVPARNVNSSVILSAEKLAGMTPRRGLFAGKPVNVADIEFPLVVKKGDAVTMTLKNSIMNLTAQGKALESGAEGQTVRVLNTSSNQVVEGIVTGPQSIAVMPPSSVSLASNM